MDNKKDAFGRDLPNERVSHATDNPAGSTEEITAPQAGLSPSDLDGLSPAKTPDAPDGPEYASELDPEPPIADDAVPTRLEFLALRERVTALEEMVWTFSGGSDPDKAAGGTDPS